MTFLSHCCLYQGLFRLPPAVLFTDLDIIISNINPQSSSMCLITQVRKSFSSCFSCVCISHSLVVSLRFWLALNPCMWNTHQAKEAAEEQVLKEQGCLLRHEGRGCAKILILIARCSDQNKQVTPIVHLSCREVVVPTIEIAWKKQKAGWGAALT